MQPSPAAQHTVNATYGVTVIAFIFLVLKLGVRYKVTNSLGWDDACAAASWIVTIPLAVAIQEQASHGMGYHSETLDPKDIVAQTQWFWASIWVYLLALGLSKMSILIQYLRIFIDPRTVLTIRITFVFVFLWMTQAVLVSIFQCIPVESFWNRELKGKCINATASYYANIALNIATDFIIILLPIPALNQLHITSGQRIGLVFAFAIGGAGCIMSLVRLHTVAVAISYSDPGWANPSPSLWSAIEVAVCIICACLPSLRPLLIRILALCGIVSTHGQTSHPSNLRSTRPGARPWATGDGAHGRLGSQSDHGNNELVDVEDVELKDAKDQRIRIETRLEVVSTAESGAQSRRSGESNDALVPDGRWYQAQAKGGK